MTKRIGILAFDDLEELDAIGPWEVIAWASKLEGGPKVSMIGVGKRDIVCAKGLRVTTEHTMDDHPPLDVMLVPGGQGTRPIAKDGGPVIDWIVKTAPTCEWVTSVCTGALLLHKAGLLKGRRATTHWRSIDLLKSMGDDVDVMADVRFVRDGNVVTSAGVSAGIDMSLWLLGQIYGTAFARTVQKGIEYYPAPPYTAEV